MEHIDKIRFTRVVVLRYLSGSKVGKRCLAGGVGAWSKIQELEHAVRLRSWRGQRYQGAGLWNEVVQPGCGVGVAATSLVTCVYYYTTIPCN